MISLHPSVCPCLPASSLPPCFRHPGYAPVHASPAPPPRSLPSSLPPLQPLYFLFRSKGPSVGCIDFPSKPSASTVTMQVTYVCVCGRAVGTRTDCSGGVHERVHERARASVWVHVFAHWFQGVKYARSSRRKAIKET